MKRAEFVALLWYPGLSDFDFDIVVVDFYVRHRGVEVRMCV